MGKIPAFTKKSYFPLRKNLYLGYTTLDNNEAVTSKNMKCSLIEWMLIELHIFDSIFLIYCHIYYVNPFSELSHTQLFIKLFFQRHISQTSKSLFQHFGLLSFRLWVNLSFFCLILQNSIFSAHRLSFCLLLRVYRHISVVGLIVIVNQIDLANVWRSLRPQKG